LINSNLGVLNAVIGGFAQQNGYQHLTIGLEQSQVASVPPISVLLQLNKDTFNIPTQGNGQITGAIRWDSKAGNAANCSTMRVAAKAIVGYAQQGQVFAPQSVVGSVQISGMKQNGDVSECDYVIIGLPYGIPLEIDATANGAWTGPAAYDLKEPRPDGWSGHVTVDPWGVASQQQRLTTTQPSGAAMPAGVVSLSQTSVAKPAAVAAGGRAAPTRAPLRNSFATMTRNNPRGIGTVNGV